MALLNVDNVVKHFATQKAVDGISFTIEPGSIFGLLGPNGAGKTTLLRMITAIIYPDSGRIAFNNNSVSDHSYSAQIGYMPEERGLYKKMKIGEQAIYLARLKGLNRKDAEQNVKKWFVKFNMETWWDKTVEDLSKGMSQKLQFVTTVAHDPKLIILDEPFSGLDPVNANLIKDVIFDLASKGHTIIFSTHRMEQVEEICNHIILINKGKKILDGTVKEVKQAFKENLYMVNLGNNTEKDDGLRNSPNFIEEKDDHYFFKLGEGESTNDLLMNLINRGYTIKGFNEKLPTLNEIFIRLVNDTEKARQFQNVDQL